MFEERTLEALLAATIVAARSRRDAAAPEDKRELSLVVTKVEEAALWLCEHKAREHLGEQAILDWLLEI